MQIVRKYFFSLITEEKLDKTNIVVKIYIDIKDECIEIIKHCRKLFLFNKISR